MNEYLNNFKYEYSLCNINHEIYMNKGYRYIIESYSYLNRKYE